jgi:hypothetical protein
VIRKHWRSLEFWRWWWQARVRIEVKALSGLVVLALMLGGGWIAADRLSTASASVSTADQFLTFETTVQRVVTVREKGKLVRKLVPVVKKVFVKRKAQFKTLTDVQTDVIKTPGGTRTVEHKVVKLVPVLKKKVITVNGKTKTLVTTQLVPTTNVQTQVQTQTQTQTQVLVHEQTATQTQTQTQTQTETNTVTDVQTVTQPVTQTVITTVTQDPVTVTTTVTLDPVTITVTIPGP